MHCKMLMKLPIFITIKLYRLRLFLGTFTCGFLEVPVQGSGLDRMGLDVDWRAELASDFIITLPKQFLKFPDENKAMPTYSYQIFFEKRDLIMIHKILIYFGYRILIEKNYLLNGRYFYFSYSMTITMTNIILFVFFNTFI